MSATVALALALAIKAAAPAMPCSSTSADAETQLPPGQHHRLEGLMLPAFARLMDEARPAGAEFRRRFPHLLVLDPREFLELLLADDFRA